MENRKKQAVKWYSENRNIYEKLCGEIVDVLTSIFEENSINCISITSRAKTLDSFEEKCKKDKYQDPIKEIQDLSGIRITTYTNSEVEKVASIIEDSFEIDERNSGDKSKDLDVDRFGYLSIHYVATLKDEYLKIPKYTKYKDLKFEIQVRTLLQHAWSEIEHDRNYKFRGALPKELKRRFYMIAGVLELVDKEFDLLTEDITKYANDIDKRISLGDLNIELSDTSIKQYLKNKLKGMTFTADCYDDFILELNRYGIKSIADFEPVIKSISKKDLNKLKNIYKDESSIIGFLRDLMILHDKDEYFSNWYDNWSISTEDVNYFENFGIDIKESLDKYKITLHDNDSDEDEDEILI